MLQQLPQCNGLINVKIDHLLSNNLVSLRRDAPQFPSLHNMSKRNRIQFCCFNVPNSRPDKITRWHQTGMRKFTVSLEGISTIPAEFQRLFSPVSLFSSLDGKSIVEKMRDQLRFSQFDFYCNKFWHRCVPADLEMPVGYPESWFGAFCVNLFARRGMLGVTCTVWTVGTAFLTVVPIKNRPLTFGTP